MILGLTDRHYAIGILFCVQVLTSSLYLYEIWQIIYINLRCFVMDSSLILFCVSMAVVL